MDKVVHFEITFDDQQRAKDFYGSVFDWDLQDSDMGNGMTYTSAITTPINQETRQATEPGAINGGFTQRGSDTPAPVITIGVDSIDDTLKKIESSGGAVVTPRTPIPDMGAFAYFKDSEGNTMGLWEASMM
jgi:predicted enzyme related to lactoylglutathione lyase